MGLLKTALCFALFLSFASSSVPNQDDLPVEVALSNTTKWISVRKSPYGFITGNDSVPEASKNSSGFVRLSKTTKDDALTLVCEATIKHWMFKPKVIWRTDDTNSMNFTIDTRTWQDVDFDNVESKLTLITNQLISKVFRCTVRAGPTELESNEVDLEFPHEVVCQKGNCLCKDNNLVLIPGGPRNDEKCLYPSKYSDYCDFDEQCQAYDVNSYCPVSRCSCKAGFEPRKEIGGFRCVPMKGRQNAGYINKDIYKAAMVALTCFVGTIIGLLLVFLCKRSFVRRSCSSHGTINDANDLFNVTDGIAAMRHIDKPPTYLDVVVLDQMVHGEPPPAYREVPNRTDRRTVVVARLVPNVHMPLAGEFNASNSRGITNAAYLPESSPSSR